MEYNTTPNSKYLPCKSQRISLLKGFGAVCSWSSGLPVKWKYSWNEQKTNRKKSIISELLSTARSGQKYWVISRETRKWYISLKFIQDVMAYSDTSGPHNCEGFLSLIKGRCPVWETSVKDYT